MKTRIKQKERLDNKGFSMVEIVVIIAIMIVLLAILTPSLLRYTENSRIQKDDTAMDELCGTVQLALADAETFDEACSYAILNNYITYTDSSGVYGAKYADEEFWAPDGSGHAVTITFNPDENGSYTIANGLVNDMTYGNGSVADTRTADNLKQCYFSEMGDGKLYHKVEQTFGSTFSEKSATYNNSSCTVFITFDVVNGIKRADVYGEWNGTNLSPDCPASLGSGTSSYTEEEEPEQTKTGGTTQSNYTSSDLSGGGGVSGNPPSYKNYLPCGHLHGTEGDHSELGCKHYACENCACVPASCGVEGHYEGDGMDHITKVNHTSSAYRNPHVYKCQCEGWLIPEGATYKGNNSVIYAGGTNLPCGYNPRKGNTLTYGSYVYYYKEIRNPTGQHSVSEDVWSVRCQNNVADPGPIMEEIVYRPVTILDCAFQDCSNMIVAPKIPSQATDLSLAFWNCKSMKTYAGSTDPDGDFSHFVIPETATDLSSTFNVCEAITNVSGMHIPENASISGIFNNCRGLKNTITLPCRYSIFSFWNVKADVDYYHTDTCSPATCISHTGGVATCQQKAKCSGCNTEYGNFGAHQTTGGICSLCGIEVTCIETPHYYPSNQQYAVVGTWDYSGAQSVNITIDYQTESTTYDWIALVQGTSYTPGQRNVYLTPSGVIKSIYGYSSSAIFGGKTRTVKTFSNVDMLQGMVILYSDSSFNAYGALVTITPNY